MWKCKACGEDQKDQFDTCWKCGQAAPGKAGAASPTEGTQTSTPAADKSNKAAPQNESAGQPNKVPIFSRWCRGWVVLLLVILVNFCLKLFLEGMESIEQTWMGKQRASTTDNVLALMWLAVGVVAIPVIAYTLQVWLFGQPSWAQAAGGNHPSPEESALALLQAATKLEVGGKVEEAISRYQQVVDRYPGTTGAYDAQKSIEVLQAHRR
jgi:hypothetical protein